MKAIVYTSATGFTENYARLLSEKTGLPAYELAQARSRLASDDEVLYMGWLFAGGVKGLKKAQKLCTVKGVCAVGMTPPNEQNMEQLKKRAGWSGDGFFVLQGGYAPEKLHGLNKILLNKVTGSMIKKLEAKTDRSSEEEEMLEGLKNGFDGVSAEAVEPVAAWLQKQS